MELFSMQSSLNLCLKQPNFHCRGRYGLLQNYAAGNSSLPPIIKPPTKTQSQMLVYAPPHPLVKHWLAIARNESTPPATFRNCISELSRILIYEAVREFLPTMEMEVPTPLGVNAAAEVVDSTRPIKLVPILRAGMVMLEQAGTVIPVSETYHVGYVRNEETLKASEYLNKLPEKLNGNDLFLIADVMLATGGTMVNCIDDLLNRGAQVENIRVVSVLAAAPGLKMLSQYKGLKVYTAMIDAELNDKGYIVPGLGDAGDRAYGTLQ
eukprot:TRINITY_DN28634_c0_g1_i3.p1 TRINITY_DN28634_c0_g1~~TRINITY_DN28634_c0_g1_i3.p1  ORF type:complete len:266 (-),score=34.81 TRINITY_DN28634_c0_g1_i3:132-929(-)